MRSLAFSLLLLLPVLSCMTQPSEWHRIYRDHPQSEALALARDVAGNYYLAGSAQGPGPAAAWLQSLDPMGLTRVTERYAQPDAARQVCALWQSPEGDWLLAGTEGEAAFLMCLSPKLDLRWTQRYLPAAHMGAIQVRAGGAVPGGSFLAGEQGGRAWCAMIDARGRLRWAKTLDATPGGSVFHALTATRGGYVALAGSRDHDFLRIGMSLEGAHHWEMQYGAAGPDAYYAVLETRDGHLLFAGATDDFGAGRTNHFITKTGPDGQVIWEKVWGRDRNQDGLTALAEGDGVYYLAGYQDAGGIIITCDPAGKWLRQQFVQPVGDQGVFRPAAILVDDAQHVVLAGQVTITGEAGPHAYGGRIRLQATSGPEPQPLPPAPVEEPEISLTQAGAVQLTYLSPGEAPAFLPVVAEMEEGRYRLSRRDWPLGQRFQLRVDSLPAPYLYAFSIDAQRGLTLHYPRAADTALTASSLPLVLPHPDTALTVDLPGTDHLVLLFAQEPIAGIADIAAGLARSRAPLYQSLRTQLGPRLVSPQAVRYASQATAFTAAMGPNTVVPLIIAVETPGK